MTKLLSLAAFVAGLAAVGWVGAGYLVSHPLALMITLLIGAFYLLGAFELRRFSQATQALVGALQSLSHTPASLDDWLAPLPAALRNAVRQRIEGARTGLPGPTLASYLTGLLVLLGMLGTFLGMVVTLDGTGAALAGADGPSAIRDALSTPVRGLGLAFGTSVAGVAASAMLGLIAALCRRERIQAVQQLDAAIASTLRIFTSQHQREASLRLLEQQANLMPDVVERIQACMTALERQQQALTERLAADQARFYRETEFAYKGLAAAVQQTLADSATQAGAALQPAIQATLAGLARESTQLQEALAQQVRQQLGGLATQFGDATTVVTTQWRSAQADHQRTSEASAHALSGALERFSQNFEQRSSALAEGLAARLERQSEVLSARWGEALDQQAHGGEQMAQLHQQTLQTTTEAWAQHATALQHRLTEQDTQRMVAWTQSLEAMAATLRQEWQQVGAQATVQQQQWGETLTRAAGDITRQLEAQAHGTLGEVERLVQVASEAPRAAAEVIGELRQKLADGMARDNAMLDERSRILETVSTLLDTVNHASTEQRSAIDALVLASSDLMERAGGRFAQTLEAQTEKMNGVAAQLTSSAVEVASLGEAFGGAVQLFGQSNEQLVAQLQRIEAVQTKSLARSDEQLEYYVAQAREVIELSIGAQKQIIDDLHQLAEKRGAVDVA